MQNKLLVPDAKPGMTCLKAFYNRKMPCEKCVMNRAKENGQGTMEVYNPNLKLWVLADAAVVEWNRQAACLVGCRDISVYK